MKEVMKKIKNYLTAKDGVFAKGMGFKKMFFLFLLGSFLGCIYEDILSMYLRYRQTGIISYITKRGLLYGELSPIYGWGACLMVYFLLRKPRKKHEYFLIGALIGGFFEYLISFLQEAFTGTVSWDYSNRLLNINGRTTIPYMLFWGLLAYIVAVKIYPIFSKMIEQIPIKIGNIIFYLLLGLVSFDMILSFSACIRLGLRHRGYEPITKYGEFLDKNFNDERMSKAYTNMVVR